MESKKSKSRNLSIYEFFNVLQIEYIVAELRVRIYPKKKDKDYWSKVKEGKQRIFESIAEKNHLPTVLTDEEMKRVFEQKVYAPEGFPNFLYKNEENKKAQEPFDLIYYYSKGAEVRYDWFGETKIGKIRSYVPYEETLLIQLDGEVIELPVQKVTRIL